MNFLNEENIYREYKDKVTRYVSSKVGDTSRVEDLVSDIFLKVYENLDKYDPSKSALSTWIYTITSNKVTDYYRTRKVFAELPSENGEEGPMPTALIDTNMPEGNVLASEQLDELADALLKLTERERDLIILHYYNNLTLKVIAEKMGMSYANVKIVHKKALNKMRECMEY